MIHIWVSENKPKHRFNIKRLKIGDWIYRILLLTKISRGSEPLFERFIDSLLDHVFSKRDLASVIDIYYCNMARRMLNE